LIAATKVQAATAVKIAIPSIGAKTLSSSTIELIIIETTAQTIRMIIVRSLIASKHKAQNVFGGRVLNELGPYLSVLASTSDSEIPTSGFTYNPSKTHLLPPFLRSMSKSSHYSLV
jgi:hypothetical protein